VLLWGLVNSTWRRKLRKYFAEIVKGQKVILVEISQGGGLFTCVLAIFCTFNRCVCARGGSGKLPENLLSRFVIMRRR
jgi:hypothetical protein